MATAVQVEALWNGLTDNNGEPLAGGKVYTYIAGTSTPVSLYTEQDKGASATNPLILDAYGRAQVWADGRYKFVVKTSADVTLYTLDELLYGFDDATLIWGGLSTGSANAQVVTAPETVTAYTAGSRVAFIAGYTNSGATTLQIDGLSTVNVVKGPTAQSLEAGDITAGQLINATYYNGSFYIGEYPTLADIQRSRYVTATNVGGTNAITADLDPAISSYETGLFVRLKAANTNTNATTLAVNGLAAKTVKWKGQALTGGEIQQNAWVDLVYDGTDFQILNHAGNATSSMQPMAFGQISNGTTTVNVGATTVTTLTATSATVTSSTNTKQDFYQFSADNEGNVVRFFKSRGAASPTNTVVTSGDDLGRFDFISATGSTYQTSARITGQSAGVTGSNHAGRLIVSTLASTGSLTERVRIDQDGNVGIGTTPSTKLHVTNASGNTEARVGAGSIANTESVSVVAIETTDNRRAALSVYKHSGIGNACGHITLSDKDGTTRFIWPTATGILMTSTTSSNIGTTTGTAIGDQTASDARVKDVSDLPFKYGLEAITQIEPVEFSYKGESEIKRLGFIAQQVKPVVPEAVASTGEPIEGYDPEDPKLVMSYSALIPVLVQAVKELSAKVANLELQIAGA